MGGGGGGALHGGVVKLDAEASLTEGGFYKKGAVPSHEKAQALIRLHA